MRRSSVAVLALLSVAPCGVALTGVAGAAEPKAPASAARPSEAVPPQVRVASVSTRKASPAAGVVTNAALPVEMAAPFAADWVTSPGPIGPSVAAGFALRGALSDNAAAAPPAAEPVPAPAVAVIAVPASPRLALASIPLPLKRSDAPPPRPSPALAMAPEAVVPAAFASVTEPAAVAAAPTTPAAKDKPRLVAAPVPLPLKRPTRVAALAPAAVDTAAIASDAADAEEVAAPVVEAEPAARPIAVGKKRLTAAQAPPEIEVLIERHSRRYDVPASLVRRVLWRESKYNPRARNGPYWGLMQIRVDTARGMGFRGEPADLLDANTNMTYAVAYLANAWRVSGRSETRAVQLYAGGYYFEAKRKGLLGGLIKTALVD